MAYKTQQSTDSLLSSIWGETEWRRDASTKQHSVDLNSGQLEQLTDLGYTFVSWQLMIYYNILMSFCKWDQTRKTSFRLTSIEVEWFCNLQAKCLSSIVVGLELIRSNPLIWLEVNETEVFSCLLKKLGHVMELWIISSSNTVFRDTIRRYVKQGSLEVMYINPGVFEQLLSFTEMSVTQCFFDK